METPEMKNQLEVTTDPSENISEGKVSRRKFFGNLGKAAVTTAAIGSIPLLDKTSASVVGQTRGGQPFPATQRALQCYQIRVDTAKEHYLATPGTLKRENNSDEQYFENKIASYTKGLPHQPNGEVVLTAYNALINALNSGNPALFEQIPLGGDRKFVNPQSGKAFDMEGNDSYSMVMPPPPVFESRELGAEIAENYWMALLRDIPFSEYNSHPTAQAAAADLNLFGADFKGAKDGNGQVTTDVLFRGLTTGDKAGPYLSQFFYLPCNFGANKISQKIKTASSIADGGADYMTDFPNWLAVQNGVSQGEELLDPTLRYMRNGRDLGRYVHVDVLFQGYFQAFLVLAGSLEAALDSGNPYNNSQTQIGFGTFGGPHIASLLCEVATRALKAVWNQKWYVHRRFRPEVFAARIDRTLYAKAGYPVEQEILDSISSANRLGGYLPAGNAFLPQAFPEGSPTHPAYGAGHATVAGACVTILKAFFDESFVIQNPLMPDPTGSTLIPYNGAETLTVGGELNKIASNVALGRNIAGVHWRSDGTESLKLGEAVAISILKDQKTCFTEQFNGFNLTKFDGTTITV